MDADELFSGNAAKYLASGVLKGLEASKSGEPLIDTAPMLPQRLNGERIPLANTLPLLMHIKSNHYTYPVYLTDEEIKERGLHINSQNNPYPMVVPYTTYQNNYFGNYISKEVFDRIEPEVVKGNIDIKKNYKYVTLYNIDDTNFKELHPDDYKELEDRAKLKGHSPLTSDIDTIIEKGYWPTDISREEVKDVAYNKESEKIVIPNGNDLFENAVDNYYSKALRALSDSVQNPQKTVTDTHRLSDFETVITATILASVLNIDPHTIDGKLEIPDESLKYMKENPLRIISSLERIGDALRRTLPYIKAERLGLSLNDLRELTRSEAFGKPQALPALVDVTLTDDRGKKETFTVDFSEPKAQITNVNGIKVFNESSARRTEIIFNARLERGTALKVTTPAGNNYIVGDEGKIFSLDKSRLMQFAESQKEYKDITAAVSYRLHEIRSKEPLLPEVTFKESPSTSYRERTIQNITETDITVAFAIDFTTAGEKLTKREGELQGKYIPISLEKDMVYESRYDLESPEYEQHLNNVSKEIKSFIDLRCQGKDNIKINIAGNGIYTLNKHSITQTAADYYLRDVINYVQSLLLKEGRKISLIQSGGQTGIDMAGIHAAMMNSIPAKVLVPGGYKIRNEKGQDISLGNAENYKLQLLMAPIMRRDYDIHDIKVIEESNQKKVTYEELKNIRLEPVINKQQEQAPEKATQKAQENINGITNIRIQEITTTYTKVRYNDPTGMERSFKPSNDIAKQIQDAKTDAEKEIIAQKICNSHYEAISNNISQEKSKGKGR